MTLRLLAEYPGTAGPVAAHLTIRGALLGCMLADGKAMQWNRPDPWRFCPYCDLDLQRFPAEVHS